MSVHGTIRRYCLILEKLERKQKSSFRDIQDYLYDHGFEISARTIQRDIDHLRVEFGIEIRYERGRGRYSIDEENSLEADVFIRFLRMATMSELFTKSLRESKDALQYISFEAQEALRGVTHLKHLLFAIKQHRMVSFVHESFFTSAKKQVSIAPYMLREYQNRWYVVGTYENSSTPYVFGIDRIYDLKMSDKVFKPDEAITPHELFRHVIGLTLRPNKIEDVVLSFTPQQGKYVKALPWHPSQEIVADNDKEFRVRLRVAVNYELEQKILTHTDAVQVISPKELAHTIRDKLLGALRKYEN